ncbi:MULTISPECIES: MarR family winged helix-turn-helix transcriptional regulator [Phyllobacteriaceae]|uniref:MarR family winged helix-turn-helix transcriptional regulator n=1 Tax=Phyllobacteriaceae TaxID=69277 RepID=UPI002ACA696E|nr:MarR family transcriptional regulator [Chelativorans sp. M5D2P16]MDZ5697091.1 MarR family transcriptional regulator [Chelativorans sp. M5D2P16]
MPDNLQLDQFLCFSIYSAEHTFNEFYRPLLAELGLTYPQYLVMVSLWSRDDRTVREIGAELSLESNTLTPLLKRLEALGLVSRTRDAKDERQVRIRLTEKGRQLKKRAEPVPACVADALGLSGEELEDLRQKLLLVQQRLKETMEKQG